MSPRLIAVVPIPDPASAYGARDPGTEACERFGYLTEEYLISGDAAGAPFTTRLLVRRPSDPDEASGIAVVEPMHMESSRPIWSTIHGQLMRAGHTWTEVACQYGPATTRLVPFDQERYAAVQLATGDASDSPVPPGADPRADRDTFIAWWWWASPQLVAIVGHAIATLRAGAIPGVAPRRVVLTGISQTGGVVRRVAGAAAEDQLPPDATPDGLLANNSGGDPMATAIPGIELLAEADLESVRAGAGLTGQGRGLRHRQPDSETFRLYEVGGMAHADSRRIPANRQPPEGKRWSQFPHGEVIAAALDALVGWIDRGVAPPDGRVLETEPGSERILRDELGHPLGGVRTIATDLPRARLEPLGDGGRAFPFGCETPLTRAEFAQRYGSEQEWRERAATRAAELVSEGWLLPNDARLDP